MKIYGLLGHPLGHSFSKKFHNERFATLGIDAEYVNYDLEDICKLPSILADEPLLCGLNVTIPYKQDVMQFLDELDPVAARIGAVNTVRFERGEVTGKAGVPHLRLIGYNTDIIGFTDSIKPLLAANGLFDAHVSPKSAEAGIINNNGDKSQPKALILGTGGASKAVYVALKNMGIAPAFVSRSARASSQDVFYTYADLTAEIMAEHLVIVNCSPVGMFPKVEACPDIPYEHITSKHVCYDLIYNPAETMFLSKSKEQGASIMSGGAMLEGQAIASYEIWTRP